MKYGIDISSYQRNIDYNKVIKNINFAILRVGFGVNYLPESQKDNQFENHYKGEIGQLGDSFNAMVEKINPFGQKYSSRFII